MSTKDKNIFDIHSGITQNERLSDEEFQLLKEQERRMKEEEKRKKERGPKTTLKLYDQKERKVVEVKEDDILSKITLDTGRFTPVQGEKYMVYDKNTGEANQVLGENLNQALGNGKNITTPELYTIRKQLQEDHSQLGQFAKSFYNEAVLLGLGGDKPKNEWERKVKEEKEKLFGTAQTAGKWAGVLAPFLAGGVAGLVKTGAKQVAKNVVKKGLQGAGKLPSALAIKGTMKAGQVGKEIAEKAIRSAGGGKLAQKMAGAAGMTIGVGSTTGAIEGIKAGINKADEELAKKKDFPGGKKVLQTFSSALGEGVETFAEVGLSTAGLMAGFGAAGLVGKGLGAGAGLIGKGKDKIAENARRAFFQKGQSFYNNRFIQRAVEKISNAFDMPKNTKPKDAFKRAEKYIQDKLKGKPLLSKTAIDFLEGEVKKRGKNIGDLRTLVNDKYMPSKNIGDLKALMKDEPVSILNQLESLKKLVPAMRQKGSLKSFVTRIDKLKNQIKNKKVAFKFHNIKQILDEFDDLAKFEKGALPTDINKIYRKAYARMSAYENKILGQLSPKNATQFIDEKKAFQQAKALLDTMDTGITPGFGMSAFHQMKDVAMALGLVTGGGLGFGTTGALTALGAAGVHYGMKTTGFGLLRTAQILENAHRPFKLVKSVSGWNTLMKIAQPSPVSFSSVSTLFLNRALKNPDEFREEMSGLNEIDQVTTGQEDLYNAIEDYGGASNANAFNQSVINLKQYILRTMPKPEVSYYTGKKTYSKIQMNKWLNEISNVISPNNFVSAFKQGNLTKKQLNVFSTIYPRFLDQFTLTLSEGLQTGKIKMDSSVRRFLDLREDSTVKDRVFTYMDRAERMQDNQQKARNRKFTAKPLTSQTVSESAQAGVMG